MDFEIVVDGSLVELGLGVGIEPNQNKWLVSVVNGFQDGLWRHDLFQNFIWDNMAETALSAKERAALHDQPKSLLMAAAKNLRLTDSDQDIGKGSELAEIVLYGLMRHKYRALPVVPKIFYKQNVQDNAKGADSVHIVVTGDNQFTLWFGEAKFYKSIEDARLTSIVTSIRNSLATDKLKKENAIIVNLQELDGLVDPAVCDAIRKALSNKSSIDSIKPLINVPILLLHECEITAAASERSEDFLKAIENHHRARAIAYFKRQASSLKDVFKYAEIKFHLILFPVPEKESIIGKFVDDVSHFKG